MHIYIISQSRKNLFLSHYIPTILLILLYSFHEIGIGDMLHGYIPTCGVIYFAFVYPNRTEELRIRISIKNSDKKLLH